MRRQPPVPVGSSNVEPDLASSSDAYTRRFSGRAGAFLGELCRVAARTVVVNFPSWMSANAASAALYPAKRLYERDTRPFHSFHIATIGRALGEHGFMATFCSAEWLLPMVVHRMAHAAPLRWLETLGERTGLTRRLGNPVILRADRLPLSGLTPAHAD